jgi:hypothetical protein
LVHTFLIDGGVTFPIIGKHLVLLPPPTMSLVLWITKQWGQKQIHHPEMQYFETVNCICNMFY